MTKKVYILEESTWDHHENVVVFDKKPTKLVLYRFLKSYLEEIRCHLKVEVLLENIQVDDFRLPVYSGDDVYYDYYIVCYEVER